MTEHPTDEHVGEHTHTDQITVEDNDPLIITDNITNSYHFETFLPDDVTYRNAYTIINPDLYPLTSSGDPTPTLYVSERLDWRVYHGEDNRYSRTQVNASSGSSLGRGSDDLYLIRSGTRILNDGPVDGLGPYTGVYSQVRSYTNLNGVNKDDGRLDKCSSINQVYEWTTNEEFRGETAEIFGAQTQLDSFRIQHHIETRDFDTNERNLVNTVTPFEVKTSGGTDPSAVTFDTTVKYLVDPVDPRDAATKHYVDQHHPTGITNGNASIFVDDQGSVRMQAANTEGQPTASFFLTEHGAGGFNVNGSFFANGNREASFGGGGHTFTLDERGYTFRHNREEVTFTFDEIKRLKELIG